jgi:hypothetical protein
MARPVATVLRVAPNLVSSIPIAVGQALPAVMAPTQFAPKSTTSSIVSGPSGVIKTQAPILQAAQKAPDVQRSIVPEAAGVKTLSPVVSASERTFAPQKIMQTVQSAPPVPMPVPAHRPVSVMRYASTATVTAAPLPPIAAMPAVSVSRSTPVQQAPTLPSNAASPIMAAIQSSRLIPASPNAPNAMNAVAPPPSSTLHQAGPPVPEGMPVVRMKTTLRPMPGDGD